MKKTPLSAALFMISNDVFSSHWWPNVMVPRQTSDTRRPVRPSWRTFMARPSAMAWLVHELLLPGQEGSSRQARGLEDSPAGLVAVPFGGDRPSTDCERGENSEGILE